MNIDPKALGLVALMALTGPSLAQGAGGTIDVGGWKIRETREEGKFQGCSATNTFDDQSVIGLAATKDVTFMIVSEPKSRLTKDQMYQVKYKFDSGKQSVTQGKANGPDLIFVPMPDNDVKGFMAANFVHFSYGGLDYDEPLDGSTDAIAQMGKCMDAGMAEK